MKYESVYIIAEAGINHNGSLDLALRLVDAACQAGADAVKFQTFTTDSIVTRNAQKATYQKSNSGVFESQYEMLKKLELSHSAHLRLVDYCRVKGIEFLSTPFDLQSIEFLSSLDLPLLKIPSGEITNLPYLRAVNAIGKPVILSTGMSTMKEIEEAVDVLSDCEVALLHCTTEYPCPYNAVNLRAMVSLKEHFRCEVGYSDHTSGIDIAIAAVAMGAKVIEKHFTVDRNLPGPDHKASLEPDELKRMVMAIRNVEKALGDGVKKPALAEVKNIAIARKSIVAKTKINKGDVFTKDNLTVKRPGTGRSPMEWDCIIGSVAEKNYEEDDLI